MLRAPCQRLAASLLGVSTFRSTAAAAAAAAGQQQQLLLFSQQRQTPGCAGASSSSVSSSSRLYSDAAGGDYTEQVDVINEKFVEAREEIEYAREDAETVYFNESTEVARKAVGDVLQRWQELLGRLPEEEQGKLQRSMGLKIEQLKAELKELDDLHA